MNPILALGAAIITEIATTMGKSARGEVESPEAAAAYRASLGRFLAQLDGFDMGLAADDKTVRDRLDRLKAEFPAPATPPTTPTGEGAGHG